MFESFCMSLQLTLVDEWNYLSIGRKLYMVLHTYGSLDFKKVFCESEDKCGLEGYRLLTRENDPVSADMLYALLETSSLLAGR